MVAMHYLTVVAASLLCLASVDATMTCGSTHFRNCSDIADFLEQQMELSRTILQLPSLARPVQGTDRITEQLERISNRLDSLSRLPIFSSCQEVQTLHPDYPSGYYVISNADGMLRRIYCNLELPISGLAMVANVNFSDPAQDCPPELHLREQNGIRACGRPLTYVGSCASMIFYPPYPYTEVYGRVIAYQFGRTGGINPFGHVADTINDTYVDGVSISRGPQRDHIWTFISAYNGIRDLFADKRRSCPCSEDDIIYPLLPDFLGDHWFCESGVLGDTTDRGVFYTDDLLWDGQQCGPIEPCCNTEGQPWFHRTLDASSSDYIELRVCDNDGNNGTVSADSPLALYEIYVR